MKILMINSVCGIRSTGRICTDLATALEAEGHEVKIAYGRETVPERFQKYAVRIGTDFSVKTHGVQARLWDGAGFGSKKATTALVQWIQQWDPDVIHLHNIHGYYLNIPVLFRYLKRCGKKLIWTLHDCWAFTGHCAYFNYADCHKWKTLCTHCPQKKGYPACVGVSRAKENYLKKKALFTEIPNMTLVVPSDWLGGLAKQSFLKDYPVLTVHNGVDTHIFKPSAGSISQEHGCGEKKVLLGVAAIWDKRKGLDMMVELANRLQDEYQTVVIGVTEEQRRNLPPNMIGIPRTNNVEELAQWYSAADVYVNPTLEDNYPTTNLEAIACGTPVVTYDTGGSGESARLFGCVVEKGNVAALEEAIRKGNFTRKEPVDSIQDMVANYGKIYDQLR